MSDKNKFFLFIATLAVALSVNLIAQKYALAEERGSSSYIPPNLSTDFSNLKQVLTNLPSPVTEFINNIKQISQNLVSKSTEIDLGKIKVKSIFESLNSWFIKVSGISLVQVVKTIGSIIAWFLSLFIKLIEWGLSLI